MTSVPPEAATMRIKTRVSDKKVLAELDRCLVEANRKHLISCNKRDLHETRTRVEQIINKIVAAMIKQSPTFSKLYCKIFGVGSSYEQTKIEKPNEFDVDIVLKIPEVAKPVLQHGEVGGFAHVQLENFEVLSKVDPDMYRTLKVFVDQENFLLSEEMMLLFIQKVFNDAKLHDFPDGVIKIASKEYRITKVEYIEPALTLNIDGPEFSVSVDLVASFLLGANFWPPDNYRKNPYSPENDFFLAPARPIQNHPHKERFWRLSFHVQERQIIFHRYRLKPAMRVLKKICGHFNQTVYSYIIKTIFLWELYTENPSLSSDTPLLWKSSLSYIVLYMLEKYLQCLKEGTISHFWDARLNLLSYLSQQEIEQYRSQIDALLEDIKHNPHPEVLLKYLK
ncbi:hypothetical protein Zmor_005236 [Zophobas morio]|uniref:Cyclic GMP-AMP synthase n=1 Tax=Zophobas morio TaxID=2755281 RepID=A0AA38IRR8_9CUCU|nr:hypothetical protein Zmor_005236 [Zophobas morio]